MDFVCIAKTDVDWQTFLAAARKAVDRNVTSSLDGLSTSQSSQAAFICAISEISIPNGSFFRQLRSDTFARRHVSYTFLIYLSRDLFLLLAGFGLSVSPAACGDIAIVSGSFDVWVRAIVEATSLPLLRPLFCLMHAWFEREGLIEAWASWEKQHVDGFYILVTK